MDRKISSILICILVLLLTSSIDFASNELSKDEILKKIMAKAQENEDFAEQFGFYQTTTMKKFSDGKAASHETKEFRLTWIQEKPYLQLLKVDGKEPNAKQKKEESEKKAKFIKSLNKKVKDEEDEEDLTWDDLYRKYDFEPIPADTEKYAFAFKPKQGKLQEKSRMEKVFNRISGKFWADDQFNITRAEARLMESVRFGLGILGVIEKLSLRFEQKEFENVPMPTYFYVHFKARVALLKTEEREIESHYKDFFPRPASR